MIFFRFLLFYLLIDTLSSRDPWILPHSTSFHHALELFHARAKISNLSSSSFTLSSLLPLVINGTRCHDDLLLLVDGFINQEKWALKIVDSWGTKPPAGILEGSHLWFGSYDECLHSLYLPNNQSYAPQPYFTKYCTISNQPNNDDDDNVILQKPALTMGICLPQSCHSNDIQVKSLYVLCPSERRHVSIGAIFTLSLIILLSSFVFVAEFIPYLKEYSATSTLKRIFSLNENHSTIGFLNGIRAISLFWIILGHSFVFQTVVSDNVLHILDNLQNSYTMQLLLGAIFGVDTFFFISGFLAVVVFINTFKNQNTFHVRYLFVYYIHRYCRLIPTLVFVLLVSIYLTPWMGHGPIYPTKNGFEVAACRQQWWATILFLNNFIKPDKSCLPVTWYIANDFQFHLLAPILLIPYILNRRRLTYVLLSILLLVNIITTISIISTHPGTENGMSTNGNISLDFFEKIYITPWCRIGPFLLGMITKLILEYSHSSLSLIKIISYTIISISLSMICIYFPFYSNYFPKTIHIIYQSICHQCWGIAIGWLIFVCSGNHGGLVNKLLSWPIWTIVARLSYSAYLIHTIIILIQIYNRYSTIHYQTSVIFNAFISQTLLTLLASILVVILVETPFHLFEKHIRKYYREKKQMLINRQSYETIN